MIYYNYIFIVFNTPYALIAPLEVLKAIFFDSQLRSEDIIAKNKHPRAMPNLYVYLNINWHI